MSPESGPFELIGTQGPTCEDGVCEVPATDAGGLASDV
jgi:hypothetical protein